MGLIALANRAGAVLEETPRWGWAFQLGRSMQRGSSASPRQREELTPPVPAQAANPGVLEEEEERQVCQNLSGISIPSRARPPLSTLLGGRWLLRPGPSQELAGFAAPPCPGFPRNLISLLLCITSAETGWAFDCSSLARD